MLFLFAVARVEHQTPAMVQAIHEHWSMKQKGLICNFAFVSPVGAILGLSSSTQRGHIEFVQVSAACGGDIFNGSP